MQDMGKEKFWGHGEIKAQFRHEAGSVGEESEGERM